MQQALQVVGKLRLRGRQRNGRRQPCRQLFGEGRAGNHRQRDCVAQRFARDILQQATGFSLKAFRRPDQARIRTHQRFNLAQDLTKDMAWHHNQNVAAGSQRGRQIAFKMQRVRERDVRKESGIAAVMLQRRDMFRVMAPEHNMVAISCQSDGKSGAV